MVSQKTHPASGQLCLQFPRIEVLTSRQMAERFGCSVKVREIAIGQCVEYKGYRIWHKGHDRWEVIRID
jgi:hypothetical protein